MTSGDFSRRDRGWEHVGDRDYLDTLFESRSRPVPEGQLAEPLLSADLSRNNVTALPITVRELRADRDIAAAFPLMRQLRDRLREATFLSEVRRQQVEGYRFFGLFDSDRLCALTGVRRSHTLSRGEHLFVDGVESRESSLRARCLNSQL